MFSNDKKTQIRQLVEELYEDKRVEVQPTYPRCLVYVLPKAQKLGSLHLPENQQNKPMHEGIVLRTYRPFVKMLDDGDRTSYLQESCVKQGDHVLFQHFEGIPVPALDLGAGEYRLISDDAFQAVLELSDVNMSEVMGPGIGMLTELQEKFLLVRRDVQSKTLSGA